MSMDDPIESNIVPVASDTDFAVNDVVLAYHGHLLYEARVLIVHRAGDDHLPPISTSSSKPKAKSTASSKGGDPDRVVSYTVHYQGWKKSWEETVDRDQVFEHNDDNLRVAHELLNGARLRQQALQPATPSSDKLPGDSLPDTSPGNGNAPPANGNGGGNGNGNRSTSSNGNSNSNGNGIGNGDSLFIMPPALQCQLVDDWEFITKEYRLVKLPRTPNVADILSRWVSNALKRSEHDGQSSKEMADVLQFYFDATLSKTLLYRFERRQFVDYFNKQSGAKANGNGNSNDMIDDHLPYSQAGVAPSLVYGAEHLLRLVHKLPFMLETAAVPHNTMAIVAERVNDLIRYLQRNGRTIFLTEYQPASKQYVNKATSVM